MDSVYWAALGRLNGVGSARLRLLMESFKSGRAAWQAAEEDFKAAGLPMSVAQSLVSERKNFSPDALYEELLEKNISICLLKDALYPRLLAEIKNPPPLFYYKGSLECLDNSFAIVGSRKASPYGKAVAENFAKELAAGGFTVVSGAARGIDTAAHTGALQKGRTAAVLGSGVDVAYPAENARLIEKIACDGIVLSEYPPKTKPSPQHFPARNRIIAGLSRGVLVAEAGVKSGSLITAEFALDEGRDVMAVPGSVFSAESRGCHRLLREGALLVESAQDILAEYDVTPKQKNDNVMTGEEQIIYDALDNAVPLSVDEIIIKTSRRADNISYLLLQMELKGIVRQPRPFSYIRA
jgi:DNA processing protein